MSAMMVIGCASTCTWGRCTRDAYDDMMMGLWYAYCMHCGWLIMTDGVRAFVRVCVCLLLPRFCGYAAIGTEDGFGAIRRH